MSTQNPNTPSTMHPTLKMTWKRALKIERIARLSADPAGFSNEQIGNMLGCNKQTVVLIRQLPEYHAKMMEISTGVVSCYDAQLRENVDNMRSELRSMVPSSMMVIRNALVGKMGTGLQYKAALEVMDREGSMAKVSKTSVAVEVKPNMEVDPEVRTNLMQLLAGAPQSNAGANIVAATGGFTVSASNAAAQQKGMAEDNTEAALEALDLSTSKPN